VLQRNKLHTKFTAAAAIVASALLFTGFAGGGTTFALWSTQQQFDGGQITAGNLDITGTQVGIWDVSADRTGGEKVGATTDVQGRPIANLNNWRKVPGDTVMFRMDAKPVLVGDNLVAALTIDGLSELIDTVHRIPSYFEVSVARGGQYLKPRININNLDIIDGSVHLGNWSPHNSNIADTTQIDPDNPNIEVRVFATFDRETRNRDAVQAVNTLAGMSVGLHQVRNHVPHFAN